MHDFSTNLEADEFPAFSAVSSPERKHPIRILVVEDEDADYFVVLRMLAKMDDYAASVSRANSGLGARKSLAARPFDVVFVDYRLRCETGLAVMKSYACRKNGAPIVLLTGVVSPEIHAAALEAGALHCLLKDGLSPGLLERAVTASLRSALSRRTSCSLRNVMHVTASATSGLN